MSQITQQQVLDVLKNVLDPDLGKNIVELGFVRDVRICEGSVALEIRLTTPACPVKEQMQKQATELVSGLAGVQNVNVSMTAEVRQHTGLAAHALSKIKNIIVVGSGKGGVGKSTVTVNLAAAFAAEGAKVGLLDADIYGPSIPRMMGKEGESLDRGKEKIAPKESHGIRFMSMGFFAPGDQPLIWRGPMAHRAVEQSLMDVEWGELDYLFVDLPPGTGDVHLTLVQSVPITGGVIVSTPQDVGLHISMKTLRMLQQTNVKILGIVENMSYHICTHCNAREDIFGHGGAQKASVKDGIPFLGEIPLEGSIRVQADAGTPVVLSHPESESAKVYKDIARKLAAQISIANYAKQKLVVENV